METPLYTATVRLQIDRQRAKVVEGGNITPVRRLGLRIPEAPSTSCCRAGRWPSASLSALRLGEDAEFFKPRHFHHFGRLRGLLCGDPKTDQSSERAIDRRACRRGIVLGNRSVRPVSGSRLVDVSLFRSRSVARATDRDRPMPTLHRLQSRQALRGQRLRQDLPRGPAQAAEAAAGGVRKGRARLRREGADRRRHRKSSIAETNLAAAKRALSTLIADRIKNEQLWTQVESADAHQHAAAAHQQRHRGLRAQAQLLVTEYQEKLETYKPGYPAMVQIKNKIAEIDRQLRPRSGRSRTPQGRLRMSRNQEAEMQKRIETLKADVLDLQKRSIQYNILKREVDTNRSLYEACCSATRRSTSPAASAPTTSSSSKGGGAGRPVLAATVARPAALVAWGSAPAWPPPTCSSASMTR